VAELQRLEQKKTQQAEQEGTSAATIGSTQQNKKNSKATGKRVGFEQQPEEMATEVRTFSSKPQEQHAAQLPQIDGLTIEQVGQLAGW
jgi:hypothetical protein